MNQSRTLRRVVGVSVLAVAWLAATSIPSSAHACWDGWRAQHGRVTLTGYDETWSLDHARHLATWLVRIDVLLAARGASVLVEGDYVVVDRADGTQSELRVQSPTAATVFAVVARELHATRAERAAAMRARPAAWTIEVGRSADVEAARRMAAAVNALDLGEHGYYEAGGFPSMNAMAHVLGGSGANGARYVVIAGTFLDRAEADRVASLLAGATREPPIVRPL